MKYLLTAVTVHGKKQLLLDSVQALNIIRRYMMSIQSMEETSADLKSISFLNNITKGNANCIEDTQTGNKLKVQIH